MAGIIYTAAARAPLIQTSPAHTAGTQYSIDIKLQAFQESIEMPKTQHVSFSGKTETVLRRASKTISIVLIWPHTLNPDMEEFMFSIAGGEVFSLDPYGTVAVPDDPINVILSGSGVSMGRMTHGSEPWRQVAMQLRPTV